MPEGTERASTRPYRVLEEVGLDQAVEDLLAERQEKLIESIPAEVYELLAELKVLRHVTTCVARNAEHAKRLGARKLPPTNADKVDGLRAATVVTVPERMWAEGPVRVREGLEVLVDAAA